MMWYNQQVSQKWHLHLICHQLKLNVRGNLVNFITRKCFAMQLHFAPYRKRRKQRKFPAIQQTYLLGIITHLSCTFTFHHPITYTCTLHTITDLQVSVLVSTRRRPGNWHLPIRWSSSCWPLFSSPFAFVTSRPPFTSRDNLTTHCPLNRRDIHVHVGWKE